MGIFDPRLLRFVPGGKTSFAMREKLVIVDKHSLVLEAWASYRATLESAPRLLSLDHHTDTSRPFRRWLNAADPVRAEAQRSQWLAEIDFRDQGTVRDAISRLDNDEHILTAIKSDIISMAGIIAHNARDTELATFIEHRIACYSLGRSAREATREECDRAMESGFLTEALRALDSILLEANEIPTTAGPYIFDIDLDYLNTRKSLEPLDSSRFTALAQGAGLITIATEPDYVRHCAMDPGLSAEEILQAVLVLIRQKQG